MFSAGQIVTTTPTPTPTTGPQVGGRGGSNPHDATPPTTTEPTPPPHNTQDYITKLMCNRDVLDDEEYTQCADTLTTGYTTNRNLVPEFLRAAFDSAVEIVTNLIFTDCTAMEMRTRQSASARSRMCIPVAAETCEAERPVPPVAQCTYQAVMGERIGLLETSEPVAVLGALYSYTAFFAALAQMLSAAESSIETLTLIRTEFVAVPADDNTESEGQQVNGDCTPAGGCICDSLRQTRDCVIESHTPADTTSPPPPAGDCQPPACQNCASTLDTNRCVSGNGQSENFNFNPYTD